MDTSRFRIGDAPLRTEDARFLIGRASFLDDLTFPSLAHAVVLRSPHAHAVVESIDTAPARAMPGVLAVLTAAEVARDGLRPLPPTTPANVKTGEPFRCMPQPLLADGKVRYAGEPVALVVAETHAAALDAAERIAVGYRPLAAVTDVDAAAAPAAPQLCPEAPANTFLDWRTGDAAAVDAAIAAAAHVVTARIDNHRIAINPMEPRGAVGLYDAATGRTTLHLASQNVHIIRDAVARALGVGAEAVRLVAPDVGGNFGAKIFTYPEYVLVAWAARLTGRPVKWIASRSEGLVSDYQARDHHAVATLALDASGRFLALKADSTVNAGAYLISAGGGQTYQYIHLPGSVYRIPAIALHIRGVLTNTPPLGVTRAPGFAEAVNIIERLIDAAARQTGLDRAALRRINMAPRAEMPFTNAFGQKVDSGAFAETLDKALAAADVDGFPDRRRDSERRGRLRGLGIAYHIKGTGGAPFENVDIRFEDEGDVTLITGTLGTGQGHETTFPQILADRLGVPNERIRFRQGDTDLIAAGGGSGSSRSTYMAGTAIWRGSEEIVAKGLAVAADMLETSEGDLSFEDGAYVVVGSDRKVALLDVARRARELGRPLDTYHHWTREWLTFPNGAHIAEIEIDRDTGAVEVVRFTAVEDYGVQVNPRLVAGQAHGAILQGIGQALFEGTAFDAASGQPLTGSLMDYAMARADDMPPLTLAFNPTRCTTNPLGVKGCGEAGAVGAYPAVASAIADALAPFGGVDLDGPATPERIWRALQRRA